MKKIKYLVRRWTFISVSYLTRNPWALPSGVSDNPRTHMAYADLRYVLPARSMSRGLHPAVTAL